MWSVANRSPMSPLARGRRMDPRELRGHLGRERGSMTPSRELCFPQRMPLGSQYSHHEPGPPLVLDDTFGTASGAIARPAQPFGLAVIARDRRPPSAATLSRGSACLTQYQSAAVLETADVRRNAAGQRVAAPPPPPPKFSFADRRVGVRAVAASSSAHADRWRLPSPSRRYDGMDDLVV